MGPQPSSRGNADSHSGKHPRTALQLQWGRNLPVAEIWAWRIRLCALSPRFNGAATFQSRKSRASVPAALAEEVSATALQWGRNLPVAEMLRNPDDRLRTSLANEVCFNGAATFQSRKSAERRRELRRRAFRELQWGRNLPVAEMLDYSTRAERTSASHGRFNGAATFQSRKFGGDSMRGAATACYGNASMGPQPSSRGNYSRSPVTCGQAVPSASMGPQPSSRGNFDVEAQSARKSIRLASMGPQPSSRGNDDSRRVASRRSLQDWSSMGPQPSSRGNDAPGEHLRWTADESAEELQWGRNLPVAEIIGSQRRLSQQSRA